MRKSNHLTLLTSLSLALAIGSTTLVRHVQSAAAALPAVVITGVAVNNSSAKIDFLPVSGAKDYRVYDVSNPTDVKYGGMLHLFAPYDTHFTTQSDGVTLVFPYTTTPNWQGGTGPTFLNVPSNEIEWNVLQDDKPHTLVVQAVDQLGPFPYGNLANNLNNPITPTAGAMVGSNKGATLDSNVSTNGQGSITNTPHVIAQSAPFVVQANPAVVPIPSRPDAVQTYLQTFDPSTCSGMLSPDSAPNAMAGRETFSIASGTAGAAKIYVQGADTDHTMMMCVAGHYMDVLYDGVTPSAVPAQYQAAAIHSQYTNSAFSPVATADFSGGKLLHLTEEVDSQLDHTNRWLAWQLAPASDPLTDFRADDLITSGFNYFTANSHQINRSDTALWVQAFPMGCDATVFQGPTSIYNTAPRSTNFINQVPGFAPTYCLNISHFGGNGIGLDNRNRWDLFVTTQHMALFEDGQLVTQAAIPGGLPFSQAKVYFAHYLYATASGPTSEPAYIQSQEPFNTFWLSDVPHSDERHWDNMGFEVLPSTAVPTNNDFSSLASLIHLPASVTPTPAG